MVSGVLHSAKRVPCDSAFVVVFFKTMHIEQLPIDWLFYFWNNQALASVISLSLRVITFTSPFYRGKLRFTVVFKPTYGTHWYLTYRYLGVPLHGSPNTLLDAFSTQLPWFWHRLYTKEYEFPALHLSPLFVHV